MRWLLCSIFLIVAVLLAMIAFRAGERSPPSPERPDASKGTGVPGVELEASTATEDRGAVFGTVLRGGRVVAGRVEARLLRSDGEFGGDLLLPIGTGPAIATVTIDAAGGFEIPGLPFGCIGVQAVAADGAVGRTITWIHSAWRRARADVVIPAGPHSFSGRATWSDGRPFRGFVALRIDHEWEPDEPFDPGAVATAAEGRFVISGLDTGMHQLSALSADGPFRVRDRRIRIPFPGEYEFVVDRDLHDWTGRITAAADGKPVAGALLEVRGYNDPYRLFVRNFTRAVTDEEGRFTFRAPREAVSVLVRAAGYLHTSWDGFEDGEEIEIRLDRSATIRGVVISAEDGQPVPGVPIHHSNSAGEAATVTDAEGRFSIEANYGGQRMLYARGNGWISPELALSRRLGYGPEFTSGPLLLPVVPGGESEVKLTVVRAVRVEGRFVDTEGRPLSGYRVVVKDAAPSGATTCDKINLTTAPDGTFSCDHLIPGIAYEFHAWLPGRRPGSVGPLSGAPGETLAVSLVLPPEQFADVLVVNAQTGAPIALAAVVAEGSWRWRPTDAFGRIRVGPFAYEPLKIQARHPDYRPAELRVAAEDRGGEIIVRLTPGETISGTVLFPDGTPAEAGTVTVLGTRGDLGTASLGFGGTFLLRGQFAGERTLEASVDHEGLHLRGRVTTEVPAAGVRIVLEEKGEDRNEGERRFTVRALDQEGRLIHALRMNLLSWDDPEDLYWGSLEPVRGRTEYRIPIEHTFVRVVACDPRSAGGVPLPLGPAFSGPVPADRGELEITLPPERSLTGRVVDPGGEGVPGVMVYSEPRGLVNLGLADEEAIYSTFTGPDGSFRIGGLGDFEVVLTASVPPGFCRAEPTTVRGGDQRVELVLRRALNATLRILDEAGAPLKGARVLVDGWSIAIADQHGRAPLEGLDPDEPITLRVDPPQWRTDLCTVFLPDWTADDLEVRVPTGSTISGTVRDDAGQPVDMAIVTDGRLSVTTDEHGEFEIGPFPGGGVELFARPPKSEAELFRDRAVRVSPGASKVELVLPPCGDFELRVADWDETRSYVDAYLTIEGKRPRRIGGDVWSRGRIGFRNVPLDQAYTLFVEPDEQGRIVYAEHLRPAPEPVVVKLVPGGKISGTVVYPPGVTGSFVTAEGTTFRLSVEVGPDGTFVIPGIPPGKCRVTAYAEDPHEERSDPISAKAGDKLVLRLE